MATFVRFAGELGLPEAVTALRAEHLAGYAQALRDRGAKPTTVVDRLNALAPFFSWLVARGVLRRTPLERRIRPAPRSEPVRPLARHELQALFDACDARTWRGARDLAILWTLFDTGIRAQELCSLALADVDRQEWTIRIRHGKGDKDQRARLGQTARRVVAEWLQLWRADVPGPLFPSTRATEAGSGALRRDSLTKLIAGIGRRADLSDVHPHRFRHSFAVEFLRARGSPFELQLLLGHATLEMTRKYTAFLAEEDALAAHEFASPGDALGLRTPRPSKALPGNPLRPGRRAKGRG